MTGHTPRKYPGKRRVFWGFGRESGKRRWWESNPSPEAAPDAVETIAGKTTCDDGQKPPDRGDSFGDFGAPGRAELKAVLEAVDRFQTVPELVAFTAELLAIVNHAASRLATIGGAAGPLFARE